MASGLAARERTRWGGERRPIAVRMRRARNAAAPYLFVAPVVLFLGALLVYPVALNIVMSFQDRDFKSAVVHSVLYTVVSVAVQLVIAMALALFYSRRFAGAPVFRSLVLVSYAIPIVVSAQVFKWLLDGRGMVNSVLHTLHLQSDPHYWLSDTKYALAAVILVQLWLGVPFTMVNLLA